MNLYSFRAAQRSQGWKRRERGKKRKARRILIAAPRSWRPAKDDDYFLTLGVGVAFGAAKPTLRLLIASLTISTRLSLAGALAKNFFHSSAASWLLVLS